MASAMPAATKAAATGRRQDSPIMLLGTKPPSSDPATMPAPNTAILEIPFTRYPFFGPVPPSEKLGLPCRSPRQSGAS